jgi:hypothetical protein
MMWDLSTNSLVEVIDVEGYVSDLAFSSDGFYLKTNVGSFKLKIAVRGPHGDDVRSTHLQFQKEWILRHGYKTIWLPSELRPVRFGTAIRGEIMAFGHSSGTVTFWEISG